MCAISVIEHEISYVKQMMAKMRGDERSYYQNKVESLEFSKDQLEEYVGSGILTPDKYLLNIK
jgi:hypothetical protein